MTSGSGAKAKAAAAAKQHKTQKIIRRGGKDSFIIIDLSSEGSVRFHFTFFNNKHSSSVLVDGSFKKSKLFKVFFLKFWFVSDTLPSIGAGQGLELAPLVPKSSAAASSATKDSVITLDYVSQWRVTTLQSMIDAKLSPDKFLALP